MSKNVWIIWKELWLNHLSEFLQPNHYLKVLAILAIPIIIKLKNDVFRDSLLLIISILLHRKKLGKKEAQSPKKLTKTEAVF